MNINEGKKSEVAIKSFRKKYFLKEDEATPDWAALKRAQRREKYDQGWINFSITCPERCAEMLKSAYEQYQKTHPEEFGIETSPEEDEEA